MSAPLPLHHDPHFGWVIVWDRSHPPGPRHEVDNRGGRGVWASQRRYTRHYAACGAVAIYNINVYALALYYTV